MLGSALLGYAASLMKFITSKYHTVIVVTNLATKYFSNCDNTHSSERTVKPCAGGSWRQVCNVRISVKNIENSIINVSCDKNDFCGITKNSYCIILRKI